MNKESRYICKAKRKDNGEWVKGNLLKDYVTGQYFIHSEGNSVNESDKVNEEGFLKFVAFEVDESTICQSTGYLNVFEGDVFDDEDGYRYVVKWCEDNLAFKAEAAFTAEIIGLGEFSEDEINVKGNIFDNPELTMTWVDWNELNSQ